MNIEFLISSNAEKYFRYL